MTTTQQSPWIELLRRDIEAEFLPHQAAWSEPLADPVEFATRRLGVHLWSKQREIAEAIRTHRRTAVRACHGPGKSFVASVIAAWWIDSHPPGEAIVVSTAPTYRQVHDVLWEEIRARHKRANLPGRVLQSDEWKLDDGTLVGIGRKPADTDADGFQGIHRRFVLVILDEAGAVPDTLWVGAEAITTNADARILAIGNPTDPTTEFAKVCKPGTDWKVIGISAFETPNFTGEQVPERIRPMLVTPTWVEDAKRRGETSPFYVSRVLGEFPDIGEDTLISPKLIEAAQQRDLASTLTGDEQIRLGVDVARFGSDETVIVKAQGPVARVEKTYAKQATTETVGHVAGYARDLLAAPGFEIHVDGVGVGAGVVDQLTEAGWPVYDMQSGMAAADSERFLNARAEWWWGLRERFEQGDIDLDPDDDDLAAQLGSMRYAYTARGQIKIESKEDMRKRGLSSPDRGDALMLAYGRANVGAGAVVTAEDFDDELRDFGSYMPTY